MPSPNASDDDETPVKGKKAAHTTPRRSAAIKRPNATPRRNVLANKPTTPKSAPVHARLGAKKPETTLLGDFLLGRPSTKRPRRRSLDAAKLEMRQSSISKIQPPGAIKDRVKQWQKASAVAALEDHLAPASEPDEILLKADDETVDEEDRQRIKFRRQAPRPGRRKSREKEEPSPDPGRDKTSPKKRVVSDDHWMKKKSSPRTPEIKFSGGSPLSRKFLEDSASIPPLQSKLEDWAKRTVGDDWSPKEKRFNSNLRRSPVDDGIRIYPSTLTSDEDALFESSSTKKPFDDGIRVKPVRSEERRKPYETEIDIEDRETPRRRSAKHIQLSPEFEESPRNRKISRGMRFEDEAPPSWTTPNPPRRSKPRNTKSKSPESLAEVPVGYSAFSVLDFPVGADARASRPLKPQRTPSLSAVPKVFKKVYNEGLKIVHETVDPPRIGVNHPPSIESWLKGTSDPFTEPSDVPDSVVEAARPRYRGKIYEENEYVEATAVKPCKEDSNGNLSRRRVRTPQRQDGGRAQIESSSESSKTPGRNTVEETTPPIEPTSLKRSAATRSTATTPKSSRKLPFREGFAEALKVESETLKSRKSPGEPNVTFERQGSEHKTPVRGARTSPRIYDRSNGEHPLPDHSSGGSPRESNAISLGRDTCTTSPPQKSYNRRDVPTAGQHHLSTIASFETFETSSSYLTESSSELSQTTISQTTVTRNTESTSNIAYTDDSHFKITSQRSNPPGLKRRLTKHSDLLSILSLPDTTGPGRSKSIQSVRSVRTARSHLATATIPSLLRELANDEVKYMRELKTLVDGVIPVLLTCVLSKSESAVTAGLFNPLSNGGSDRTSTKPIVDMGIALERLKSLHRRTPLHDPDQLVDWASGACNVYEDYLNAWRMGFQDLIVNLAPAAPSGEDESLVNGGMPRNAAGDVLNEDGERVDVAFLLKRPLVRIKYLSKVMKGILRLKPSDAATRTNQKFQALVEHTRIRVKEEEARLEDEAANNTDATRVRDPKDLAPMEGVTIDRTRQVNAKDFFDLDIPHSNGQRIGCRVEFLLRDKPNDGADPGDVLICEVDHLSRWLLFPPIELSQISARLGNQSNELVVMIRGSKDSGDWHELLMLKADSEDTAQEWVEMLGSTPFPTNVERCKLPAGAHLTLLPPIPSVRDDRANLPSRRLSAASVDVPIGETHKRKSHSRQKSSVASNVPSTLFHGQAKRSDISSDTGTDNYNRTYSGQSSASPRTPTSESGTKDRPEISEETNSPTHGNLKAHSLGSPSRWSTELPYMPKLREGYVSNEDRGQLENVGHTAREDGAPIPPAHKNPGAPILKNVPVLDSKTSKYKIRKSSSPLKHEYQPSDGSGTSSASDDSDSGYGMMDSESSDEEDLEAVEPHMPNSAVLERFGQRVFPPESLYSPPSASLAPSQSASQAPYGERLDEWKGPGIRLVASISCWSERGHWKDLQQEDCAIVVGAGLIEAFVLGASHLDNRVNDRIGSSGKSDNNTDVEAGAERPLVALELTPCVPLRQSNALDIEIRSPPTARSKLKCSHTVRFRSRTLQECSALYAAIHEARMNNPVYKRLEQERILGAYGGKSYQAAIGGNRRASWFGRKKSYRASTRAPSATVSDNSTGSFSSAIARLRNIGGSGGFNIAKSTVDTNQSQSTRSGGTSFYTSSSESGTTGLTPPRTPTSPSIALMGTSNVASLGRSNLKIRLYVLETSSKWNELGSALLTVSEPPAGMRQASSLYHGVEKRILVTSDSKRSLAYTTTQNTRGEASYTVIDQVLGSKCFSRIGVVGIAMNVWEDIMGDNGEIGMVAAVGGVSGRTRKWMFQCATAKEASWIFSLVGGGGV